MCKGVHCSQYIHERRDVRKATHCGWNALKSQSEFTFHVLRQTEYIRRCSTSQIHYSSRSKVECNQTICPTERNKACHDVGAFNDYWLVRAWYSSMRYELIENDLEDRDLLPLCLLASFRIYKYCMKINCYLFEQVTLSREANLAIWKLCVWGKKCTATSLYFYLFCLQPI